MLLKLVYLSIKGAVVKDIANRAQAVVYEVSPAKGALRVEVD